MIVTPRPGRATGAVRRALQSHGLEGTSAEVSAAALEPWAYHITDAPAEVVEALLGVAPKFGLDLLTKCLVVANMTPGEPISIIDDVVRLTLVRNPGAAFSMATGMTW